MTEETETPHVYPLTLLQMQEVVRLMEALQPIAEDEDDKGKRWGDGYHISIPSFPVTTDAHTATFPEILGWIYLDGEHVRFTQNRIFA